jgi:hypothetical protein
MTSGSNNPKRPNERSLAKSLGALFALTGGLMLSSASAANAATANSGSAKADGAEQLEEQLGQGPGTEVNQGETSAPNAQPMWWGNWHNWHPGWGNGGWHNWHNWHNWGNW